MAYTGAGGRGSSLASYTIARLPLPPPSFPHCHSCCSPEQGVTSIDCVYVSRQSTVPAPVQPSRSALLTDTQVFTAPEHQVPQPLRTDSGPGSACEFPCWGCSSLWVWLWSEAEFYFQESERRPGLSPDPALQEECHLDLTGLTLGSSSLNPAIPDPSLGQLCSPLPFPLPSPFPSSLPAELSPHGHSGTPYKELTEQLKPPPLPQRTFPPQKESLSFTRWLSGTSASPW